MKKLEPVSGIFFNSADTSKIQRMSGNVVIISTVCPDYPNNGQYYTFSGSLGAGISLTANEHIRHVPNLIKSIENLGINVEWQILVADLPELTENQRTFF